MDMEKREASMAQLGTGVSYNRTPPKEKMTFEEDVLKEIRDNS